MQTKGISILVTAAFLIGAPMASAAELQREQIKVSEAEKQRIKQLSKEQEEARRRMEAEKQRQQADLKNKKPAVPTNTPSRPRTDDSTLKPGEIIPKEIPVGQPAKPKRDPMIR
jgi:FKBP-type peptidyl-prolyl cis-trans isomerase